MCIHSFMYQLWLLSSSNGRAEGLPPRPSTKTIWLTKSQIFTLWPLQKRRTHYWFWWVALDTVVSDNNAHSKDPVLTPNPVFRVTAVPVLTLYHMEDKPVQAAPLSDLIQKSIRHLLTNHSKVRQQQGYTCGRHLRNSSSGSCSPFTPQWVSLLVLQKGNQNGCQFHIISLGFYCS